MPDWTKSMKQHFEYFTVDPNTWELVNKLDYITECNIDIDTDSDTLGSASFESTEDIGECYVRPYLITEQDGTHERFPMGTYLVQSPSNAFNGYYKSFTMDAYTPLIELKEKQPPIGYSLRVNDNIMEYACNLTNENVRAPIVKVASDKTLPSNFASNIDDTWATFIRDLLANAQYEFMLDDIGRILFNPVQELSEMSPVWEFVDGENSIIYPDISVSHDMYGVPNVVEVVYSNDSIFYYSKVVNDDENSPVSIQARGRQIIYRDSNPSINGEPTQTLIDEYARNLLTQLSTIQYSVSYTHGYCPVRLGDCVRLTCARAGLTNVNAKVVSQSISCKTGVSVKEKAVFISKLWGDNL